MDADFRRQGAGAAAAASDDAQHHRSRARQCGGAACPSRPSAPPDRSRCRRHAACRHRAAAGPRLHQAAGLCRLRATRHRGWDSDPAELRRGRRRGRARQGHRRQARRADVVVGQCLGRARAARGSSDLRRRGVAQEPGRQFFQARGRTGAGGDCRRGRPPRAAAPCARTFLHGARHVLRGKGRYRVSADRFRT